MTSLAEKLTEKSSQGMETSSLWLGHPHHQRLLVLEGQLEGRCSRSLSSPGWGGWSPHTPLPPLRHRVLHTGAVHSRGMGQPVRRVYLSPLTDGEQAQRGWTAGPVTLCGRAGCEPRPTLVPGSSHWTVSQLPHGTTPFPHPPLDCEQLESNSSS